MKHNLLLIILFALMGVNMQAQQSKSKPATQAVHLTDYMASIPPSAQMRANRIQSLIGESHPAVYVSSGAVTLAGDNPVVLHTDVDSFNDVPNSTFDSSHIEMVTIKVGAPEDLSQTLDLSTLSDMPNLAYVYIISETAATAGALQGMISNSNPNINVFYNIVKPN